MSPTALVVALIALFKTKRFKRFVGRHAPWMFRDDTDILNYQDRQIRIEDKIDALMSAGGVTWNAAETNYIASSEKRMLISSRLGRLNVLFAKQHILRGNRTMKTYLKKLGSRKFQAFLAVTIPNMIIMFGFILGDIDLEGKVNEWMPAINLFIQSVTTGIYQWAESRVDVANAVQIGDSGPAE